MTATPPVLPPDPKDLVARLTGEIGALKQRNTELQERLDRMTAARATSPDDLASALQRTVDRLAMELASLSNPVSNFAVKEFRLETTVTVSLTELGIVEYRLIQPGANVDPSATSKLTLSLVPIEKQRPEGTLSALLFEPNKELGAIGVSEPLRRTLEQNHIFTVGEFRSAAMRAQVRTSLMAAQIATQQELALLQARAELVLLAGLDLAIADRLIAAGIDSLQMLARSVPEGLSLIVKEVEQSILAQWISAAQTFTGIAASEPSMRVITVDTDPAGLLVRLGSVGGFSTAPVARQLASKEPLGARTLGQQIRNHVGYAFDGWSSGGSGTAATLPAGGSAALVARFHVAGYWVLAASASAGGKVTIEPVVGGLPKFPASFYPAGAKIQIVSTAEAGFTLSNLIITTQGKTVATKEARAAAVVDAPVRALATFEPVTGRRRVAAPPKKPTA